MPIYEYGCAHCGSKEEKIQGLSAPAEHDCPNCGTGLGMKRLVSRTAFVLAGSGWYAGGYGGEGKPAGAGKEKSGEGTGDSQPAQSEPAAAPGCAGGCACHSPVAESSKVTAPKPAQTPSTGNT